MTKQEICRRIIEDMLEYGLLNEADAYDIPSLRKEAEQIISSRLEDYVLVYRTGILED